MTAAVRDRDGAAVTTRLTILADGTAPEIHVPKETVTLREGDGQVFYPDEGVYGADNFWTGEDCLIVVNMEEFEDLLAAAGSGKRGSYKLTYTAADMATAAFANVNAYRAEAGRFKLFHGFVGQL